MKYVDAILFALAVVGLISIGLVHNAHASTPDADSIRKQGEEWFIEMVQDGKITKEDQEAAYDKCIGEISVERGITDNDVKARCNEIITMFVNLGTMLFSMQEKLNDIQSKGEFTKDDIRSMWDLCFTTMHEQQERLAKIDGTSDINPVDAARQECQVMISDVYGQEAYALIQPDITQHIATLENTEEQTTQ